MTNRWDSAAFPRRTGRPNSRPLQMEMQMIVINCDKQITANICFPMIAISDARIVLIYACCWDLGGRRRGGYIEETERNSESEQGSSLLANKFEEERNLLELIISAIPSAFLMSLHRHIVHSSSDFGHSQLIGAEIFLKNCHGRTREWAYWRNGSRKRTIN